MISIIVCSANPELLAKFRLNVDTTIGTPYEMLVFDNRKEKKGIAEVYNCMAGKANYQILCFIHEDVIIHTVGWGKIIEKLLFNNEFGLVGIAGATYKSMYPGTWSACHQSLYRTHNILHFKHLSEPVITNINPGKKSFAEVAVLDGVLLATSKNVFNQFTFDDGLLNGFHGYDIDYSLQVGQRYKLAVTYELLLEHLSEGKLSNDWVKSSLQVHQKWKKCLPLQAGYISKKIKKQSDYQSCYCVLGAVLQLPGNGKLVVKYFSYLLFIFFSLNKFRYSKAVIKYFIRNYKN